MNKTTALAERNGNEALAIAESELQTVAQFLNVKADEPALTAFLTLAKRYGLDPFAKQIFLIRIPGKDGGPPSYAPACGRDGYLTMANRNDDFKGMASDVVHENDTFSAKWDFSGDLPQIKIEHEYKMGADGTRGAIVGAWAMVFREGYSPIYYFAPWAEHGKQAGSNRAWTYASAMIAKCAQSMVLRLAYSIDGFIPTDEMSGAPVSVEEQIAVEVVPTGIEDILPKDSDPELVARLLVARDALEEAAPGTWPTTRLAMALGDGAPDALKSVVESMEDALEEVKPDDPEAEQVEGEVVAETSD